MTSLPLGLGAYKRTYGRMPEIQLVNRFVERTPTNLKERVSLLTRPGTKLLAAFPPDTNDGRIRGTYSTSGVFNSDLFVVSGRNLYRYDGTTRTQITGEIQGTGNPRVAFVKGAGYERMFIADSLLLNYYDGGSHATGTLTDNGSATYTTALLNIGGTYYGWNANVDANAPDGSAAHPFLCLFGGTDAETLENMANMLNFIGTAGVDFSSVLTTANLLVSATSGPTTLTVTARSDTTSGNAIVTVVTGDVNLSWGGATLSGGGVHALHGVPIPSGEGVSMVAALNSFVFVGVNASRRFYYVRPGEVTIDPLDFAEKESAPDPLVDLVRVGDVMVVIGAASTEFWAATGQNDNPFAPVEGRALSRGAVPGTAVAVDERTILLVGNDGRVYSVSASPQVVSDHGIEERIRRELRREAGIT